MAFPVSRIEAWRDHRDECVHQRRESLLEFIGNRSEWPGDVRAFQVLLVSVPPSDKAIHDGMYVVVRPIEMPAAN